ncbi:MAG: hypothetical protein NWT08_07930 [Akkermansiaceae bacterium]|jgi:hypothetical protein|nr:hypothetical protein [Akkermansiaceae bacterium]MDP4647102.1 hypothetical protein [Akkermansiaceae bacterium]MDP4722444.1 hypothetical protein [Akkermansiaceae bacterium]MDP4780152.1 hypothetical protein [Akkermansiaceae bacterium]MDP4847148.1 hypothetical protein [Akkermansiaceae bacterium]
MKKRPIQDLISIARIGGSFRIDASAYTLNEFGSLAKALISPNCRLYITSSHLLESRVLKALVQYSGGKCVFEE